jgi:hypothetical protein
MVGARAAAPVAREVAPVTRPVGCITATGGVGVLVVGHAVDMSREIPEPVRAAAGLAATVLDEVKKLPETLPGIPVRAVGLAMQAALKLQQEYAGLVARGDELFTGIRGENEPGMATFDDDDEPAPAAAPSGYRESAFDRAEAPAPDADVTAPPVADLDQGPGSEHAAWTEALEEEALEELAIEELVDAGGAVDADAIENALLESDAATADAAVADTAAADTAADTAEATATDEGGTPVAAVGGTSAPATAPIDGYDDFSIAQLRGRLRGYAPSTVEALVAYEAATRAREPYLRMLRNRLERLTQQEVETSPLAPRGA